MQEYIVMNHAPRPCRKAAMLTAAVLTVGSAVPANGSQTVTSASASARITAFVPVICRTTVASASVSINEARYNISTLCNTRFSATASLSLSAPPGHVFKNFPTPGTFVTFQGRPLSFAGNTVTLYDHSAPVNTGNSVLVVRSPGLGVLGLTLALSHMPEG